jgi:hypothetical protein
MVYLIRERISREEEKGLPRVLRKADPDFPPLAFHLTHLDNDSTMLFSQS